MSIVIYNFKLPVFVIVLISIINDGTIITIAYDNVTASPKPEKWNLPVVCGVALCLGTVSVLFTFMMLYAALPRDPHNMNLICNDGLFLNVTLQKTCKSYLQKSFDLPVLEIDQVQALIYLQLSLSGQLTVFSARTRSWFFTRAPGRPLVIAFFIAQVASTLLAVYPLGELQPMLGLACSGADGVCQPPNYSINVS
jgi:H+-transporting ATPase